MRLKFAVVAVLLTIPWKVYADTVPPPLSETPPPSAPSPAGSQTIAPEYADLTCADLGSKLFATDAEIKRLKGVIGTLKRYVNAGNKGRFPSIDAEISFIESLE